jgi:hypothetical protein
MPDVPPCDPPPCAPPACDPPESLLVLAESFIVVPASFSLDMLCSLEYFGRPATLIMRAARETTIVLLLT